MVPNIGTTSCFVSWLTLAAVNLPHCAGVEGGGGGSRVWSNMWGQGGKKLGCRHGVRGSWLHTLLPGFYQLHHPLPFSTTQQCLHQVWGQGLIIRLKICTLGIGGPLYCEQTRLTAAVSGKQQFSKCRMKSSLKDLPHWPPNLNKSADEL